MSERKHGAAVSVDIDALLQDTWLQVISLRHGPQFQEGEGRICGSAVSLMWSAFSVN
jgi:type VI secretion system protein ImpK